ncbi:hypothetical protein TNCV_559741 [Trichonephila clavipes]|nr:hypothetical protein TNCV_559741 [Trichonephila clavipes]
MSLEILNHGQVTRTTFELVPPSFFKLPHHTNGRTSHKSVTLTNLFRFASEGLDKNVGASRFNVFHGRQGCVLARTVESNQGGRFDEVPTRLERETPAQGQPPIETPLSLRDKYRHCSF